MGGWRSCLCRTRLLAAPAFRTNVCVARKSKFGSSGLGGRDHRKLQKAFSHHSRLSPKTHCAFLELERMTRSPPLSVALQSQPFLLRRCHLHALACARAREQYGSKACGPSATIVACDRISSN